MLHGARWKYVDLLAKGSSVWDGDAQTVYH